MRLKNVSPLLGQKSKSKKYCVGVEVKGMADINATLKGLKDRGSGPFDMFNSPVCSV